ncbi:tetratricopeptide repeat protein [Mesobacillus jeotgali]|uniref:tetratricopeptide repeat protein n=1 Tax=Mesobacillus jeotgali TaxID=129985 RepID=UPI001CFC952C|nr:hypothetical protein [Mesobacillus jeotgali]
MSFLAYIAGTLIAPNLAGYLLSTGLTNRKEKQLIKEIEDIVTDFNRKFDDTEVDSNYFVDFLEQSKISDTIIQRVFNAYKTSKEDHEALSKKLAQEAVEFVNFKKDKFKHTHVKSPSDFEIYFSELFDILVNFRESLLSITDKAALSIVDESIGKSEGNIIKTIEEKLGDDYLLEKKIEDIEFLVDKGLYSETIETITELFDTIGTISKEQRAKLLFQKARIYINTNTIEKAIPIRKSIEHNCPASKFINEIDYWIGCNSQDYELVSVSIQQLRDKGLEESKLILKESNYYLQIGDFDSVHKLILDDDKNIKPILKKEASAFSQLGFVSLFRNEFENAELYFREALKIRYNISYDYHMTIAKAFILGKNLNGKFDIDEEIKEKARDIYYDLERTYYFVEDSSKEIRLQHWFNYLSLIGVDKPELAIVKFNNIDKDLVNEEAIHIVMSEIYFFYEDYENATIHLEYIWDKQSVFLARLLLCYSKLNRWESVEKIFEQNVEHLYDVQGVILFYKIQLLEKINRMEDAKQLINENSEKYKHSPWFIEEALKFLYDHSIFDIYNTLLVYVSKLPEHIELREKLSLAKVLYNHGRYQMIRELLEKSILLDDKALELYLRSYGEVNPKDENFDALQQLVMAFYSHGNRTKYLLQVKFYIELLTERYIGAIDSLKEYYAVHGEDPFYQVNFIQCITLGALDYDATNETKELLDTDDLRNHIIVAQYYAYKGRWDDAKSVLRNAYYNYYEQIEEDEMAGFLRIYFSNLHQDKGAAEYSQICDDSVALLEDPKGMVRKVGIHSNDGIITENGEVRFECINLKSTADESYMLKATGKKGSFVKFRDEKYKVLEVLNIDTYFFRYFLQKIQEEYPDNKTVIPISGETIEEMIEKTTVYIQAGNEETKNKLKLYNFDIETGVPISYLSGKDVDKYFETIYFLMNNEEQGFYSVYSSNVEKGGKYVLTVSSLVILNALGYLDRVNSLSNRLYITPSIKQFVRKGISDAIRYESVVSTAFLDEDNNFRMEDSTEETKVFKKTFWTQILVAINEFTELKPELINTSYYDKIHEFVDISEFEAINIAANEDVVLVCDDLFIGKICKAINETAPVVNIIALLYKEELVDISELIKLLRDLTKKKYLNCVNHIMLFDIYVHLGEAYGTPTYEELYMNVSEIFEKLFTEPSREHHGHLYRNFIDLVMRNNMMSEILYNLLQKPFGFRPYNELIAHAWNSVKIELKVTDL